MANDYCGDDAYAEMMRALHRLIARSNIIEPQPQPAPHPEVVPDRQDLPLGVRVAPQLAR
jgi:hypothetical protein